jgi:hypothetical protein
LNPDRFAKELLIFRKDEGTSRICVTTEDFDNGSRSSEGITLALDSTVQC